MINIIEVKGSPISDGNRSFWWKSGKSAKSDMRFVEFYFNICNIFLKIWILLSNATKIESINCLYFIYFLSKIIAYMNRVGYNFHWTCRTFFDIFAQNSGTLDNESDKIRVFWSNLQCFMWVQVFCLSKMPNILKLFSYTLLGEKLNAILFFDFPSNPRSDFEFLAK